MYVLLVQVFSKTSSLCTSCKLNCATMASASLHGAKFELAKTRLKQQICRSRLIQLQLMLLRFAYSGVHGCLRPGSLTLNCLAVQFRLLLMLLRVARQEHAGIYDQNRQPLIVSTQTANLPPPLYSASNGFISGASPLDQ